MLGTKYLDRGIIKLVRALAEGFEGNASGAFRAGLRGGRGSVRWVADSGSSETISTCVSW